MYVHPYIQKFGVQDFMRFADWFNTNSSIEIIQTKNSD